MRNMKEELLRTLKEHPELLRELAEDTELKTLLKQALSLKTKKEKGLMWKLEKWGIKKEEIPEEYLKHINMVEDFLNWLDNMIREKTSHQKALHLSLRPITHEQNPTNNKNKK